MQTLVAVYPSRAQADEMQGKLIDFGVPPDKIALSPEAAANDEPMRA